MTVRYCFLSYLSCTFLNPCDASVGAPNFASHDTINTSLYDFMKINEEMATLVMKK
jgi:hypothetical protein